MRRYLLPLLPLLVATSPGLAAENPVEPVLRRRVAPEFTAELKRRWPANLHEGSVTLDFVVDPGGTVAAAHVSRARIPELVPPALAAIKKWKFKPATRNGRAAATLMRTEIWFHVSGKPVAANKEGPPVFVGWGDKLVTSDAPPQPGEFFVTNEALPHLDKLRPHLPAELRPGDPDGRTLIEPYPILMPLPQIKRDILEQAGGWVKYRVALVVRPDGSPGNQYILSSTAPETNRAMGLAMARWTFFPGTVNGRATTFVTVTDYEVGEILTVEFGKDTPVK
ncbi:MAG TPA: TonB family protein [Lacunisphaera sp.]|nr:TonB family protein [Lacunisphaera sp.]